MYADCSKYNEAQWCVSDAKANIDCGHLLERDQQKTGKYWLLASSWQQKSVFVQKVTWEAVDHPAGGWVNTGLEGINRGG